MVSEVERRAHERVTAAWIDSDPVELVLVRQGRTDDGAGGHLHDGEVTLPPQTFRFDRAGNQLATLQTTPAMSGVPMAFRLVGDIDADVEEGDFFDAWGGRYHVIDVPRRTFGRTVAEVSRRV